MNKISAVYKIVNTITGDCYIGSSKDVMNRWACHKCTSTWNRHPNNKLYKDMHKYGVDKFRFQILAPVIPEYLKQVEQELIEMLHPTYNNYNAKGIDTERQKAYFQSEKGKERIKKYLQSEKGKESQKKYRSQRCYYKGETLTLDALSKRFKKAGIEHPTVEARKYLGDK